MVTYARAFFAGFMATLVFHQGLLHLLYLAGVSPRGGWSFAAVPPLGVPSVLSLAFFGGLWGCVLWRLIARAKGSQRIKLAMAWGALLPSAVALFIVFPLKGLGMAGGWDMKLIVGALLLNAAWGLGTALFLRALGQR